MGGSITQKGSEGRTRNDVLKVPRDKSDYRGGRSIQLEGGTYHMSLQSDWFPL